MYSVSVVQTIALPTNTLNVHTQAAAYLSVGGRYSLRTAYGTCLQCCLQVPSKYITDSCRRDRVNMAQYLQLNTIAAEVVLARMLLMESPLLSTIVTPDRGR